MHLRYGALGYLVLAGCLLVEDGDKPDGGGAQQSPRADASRPQRDADDGLTYRSEVAPVTRLEDAQKGVFIPYFRQCSEPLDGKPGLGPDGKVCANVSIAGATEPGRYYGDYASCEIVLTQRPYWPVPPAGETPENDPRLRDADYMREVAWAKAQVESTGCVCCHDGNQRPAGQWDIRADPIWIDSASDSALAMLSGLADSTVLGTYPADDNFGFARDHTGLPSTDPERMRRFMVDELARRGISEEKARMSRPFGGPVYVNQHAKPTACEPGEGVDESGRVLWLGGEARYVYVLEADSKNPGVPPDLDLPEGTIWRLDVPVDEPGIASGIRYGKTPRGTYQTYPEDKPAAALERGQTYHFVVLRDVGFSIANCLFELGEVTDAPEVEQERPTESDAGADGASGGCRLAGGDAAGFGAACKSNADCTCEASYCALQPGAAEGFCTKTGCTPRDFTGCPSGWSCFDLSTFLPGQPAFCRK